MAKMRNSERKVAQFVLENCADVIHMRIVDLATEAHVSEPTVVRFCRAINCDGFQDFKLRLAQQLASSPKSPSQPLLDSDTVAEFSDKVFDATIESLRRVRDQLDPLQLERAIEALSRAKRVEFYGFGASSGVAVDAQHKFFRLQYAAAAYSDSHLQAMSALSLEPDDVVVAISQSGQTKDLLKIIDLVRQSGATVIALAPDDSPLVERADIPLAVALTQEQSLPVASRIAHLVVIDILTVGVANLKGPAVKRHLTTIEQVLKPFRE